MPYVCNHCHKEFSDEEVSNAISVRCTYCGNKVLFKKTAPVARTFKTQ